MATRVRNLTFTILATLLACTSVEASEELMAVDTAFNRMAQEVGIAEAFDRYLGPDAKNLNGGYEPYGRSSIVDYYRENADSLKMRWWPVEAAVSASGDLGYTWGRYVEKVKSDDDSWETVHGKYIMVWRKDENGEWKSLTDMGATNPPPADGAPSE